MASSQAKWLERKEDMIDSQIQRRKKAIKKQKKEFNKHKYETLLTELNKEKNRSKHRWLRSIRRWIIFDNNEYHYEDPDAYYKKLLNKEEFETKLADELKEKLEELQDDFIEGFYDEFERTTSRTHFIKDEFMFALTKMNCIRACKTIKEDLMAAAWHPDRVWKWLKAGRYIGDVDGEPQHDFSVLNMMAGYDSD